MCAKLGGAGAKGHVAKLVPQIAVQLAQDE